MELSENQMIRVKQRNKKGRVMAETTTTSSFHQYGVAKETICLPIKGDVEAFEIIRK